MFSFYKRKDYSDEDNAAGLANAHLINLPTSNEEQLTDAS